VFKAGQESPLRDNDGLQGKPLGGKQTCGVFVHIVDGEGTQCVKNAAHLDPGIDAGSTPVYETVSQVTALASCYDDGNDRQRQVMQPGERRRCSPGIARPHHSRRAAACGSLRCLRAASEHAAFPAVFQ
jgi:hypothetical protein